MSSKYEHGKIYKIYSDIGNVVYYGSTCCSLIKRFKEHKRYPKDKYSSSKVLEYDDAKIELVEEYPCHSKKELQQREGYYQDNNECVNRCVAGLGRKESNLRYARRNAEKYKEYWHENKEKFNTRRNNKYKDNKEYRDKHQTKSKEIIACECGVEIRRGGLALHKKSNKHKIFLESGLEGWEKYKKDESKRLLKIRLDKDRDKRNARKREKRKNSPIVTCGCGKSMKETDLNRHYKSVAHKNWLLSVFTVF